MTEPRKKPSVAFWATVMVVALMLYVAGIGPAVRIARKPWCPDWFRSCYCTVYGPMNRLIDHSPAPLVRAVNWYSDIWWFVLRGT